MALLSHRLCDTTLARFDDLRAAAPGAVLLLTEPLGEAVRRAGLDAALVLSPDEIFLPAYGAKSASRRILPGNADLALLALRRARPRHARYWLAEYDVFLPGGAALLAALDAASDADLLLPLRPATRAEAPQWHHWPGLVIPPGEAVADTVQRHALLCLVRAGAALLDALDAAYRRGWAGHAEAVLPTLAAAGGFATETLNAVARRALGRKATDGRAFNAFRCQPSAGALICHPVKTEPAAQALRATLAAST
ncbi:MAG: hypothetical protein ACK4PG_05300 [Acetobacteraceae bacterium]